MPQDDFLKSQQNFQRLRSEGGPFFLFLRETKEMDRQIISWDRVVPRPSYGPGLSLVEI